MEMNYLNWEEATKKISNDVDFYFDEGYLAGLDRTSSAKWLENGITSMIIAKISNGATSPLIEFSPEETKQILSDVNGVLSQEYIQALIQSKTPTSYTDYAIYFKGNWKLSDINFNFSKWKSKVESYSPGKYEIFEIFVDRQYPAADIAFPWNSATEVSDTKINIDSWSRYQSLKSARLNKTIVTQIKIYATKEISEPGEVDWQVRTNTLRVNSFSNYLFNLNASNGFKDETTELFRRLLSKAVLSDALFSIDDDKAIKNKWSQIFNTILSTQDEYVKMINTQGELITQLTKDLENTTTSTTRYNDTPQSADNYGTDKYTSNITTNTSTSKVSLGSTADKLAIAKSTLQDIYDMWLKSFNKFLMY